MTWVALDGAVRRDMDQVSNFMIGEGGWWVRGASGLWASGSPGGQHPQVAVLSPGGLQLLLQLQRVAVAEWRRQCNT